MFAYFVDEEARDVLGNGYGVELEREVAPVLGGNLSFAAAWRRFSRDHNNFDNSLNYYTIGLKMRWGPGAFGSQDGVYYGLGGNFVILPTRFENVDHTVTGGEGVALLGGNFARSWYAEASYRVPVNVNRVNINNAAFVIGYRF